jgi:hypothetical protein
MMIKKGSLGNYDIESLNDCFLIKLIMNDGETLKYRMCISKDILENEIVPKLNKARLGIIDFDIFTDERDYIWIEQKQYPGQQIS